MDQSLCCMRKSFICTNIRFYSTQNVVQLKESINCVNHRRHIGFWNNEENVKQFITEEIKEKLNLKTMEDWKSLSALTIRSLGGKRLLDKKSMYEIKCIGYPEGKLLFKETKKKFKYWEKKENINKYIEQIKKKLNYKTEKEWNSLSANQIKLLGGRRLLDKYSIYDIKCMCFPEGKEKFNNPVKSEGYWDNHENIKKFLNEIKNKLNLQNINDWNLLSTNDIIKYGGRSLLKKYSIYELKCIGFPNGKFKFSIPVKKKEIGYWNNLENVKLFLDELKLKLNLNSIDDWNSISVRDIKLFGGSSLLGRFSLYDLKCIGNPEGKLYYSMPIDKKEFGYWNKQENIHLFLNSLKENVNIKTISDWNRLSREQIISFGGSSLLSKFSKKELLTLVFPSFDFELCDIKNSLNERSAQRWLFLQIQKLFSGEEIVEDYFHSDISRNSGFPVQFDVFLTKLNIAFEYHGKQHYEDIPTFAPIEMYQFRDNEKQILCTNYGIQLIIIPYWWDNKIDSLKVMIENTCVINK